MSGRPAWRPCGTEAAYQRHRKHGEEACGACKRAHRLYKATQETGAAPPVLAPRHGTRARYQKHLRSGEVPCGLCTRAQADYSAAWRRRRDQRAGVFRHTSKTDLHPLIGFLAEILLKDKAA